MTSDPESSGGPFGKHFATICACVALTAVALGLFWDLFPEFRPDPRDVVGADVEIVAVEPRVTLGSWLKQQYPDSHIAEGARLFGRSPSDPERIQPGELIYVKVQVDGRKHHN